jgi:hypothetical protein
LPKGSPSQTRNKRADSRPSFFDIVKIFEGPTPSHGAGLLG